MYGFHEYNAKKVRKNPNPGQLQALPKMESLKLNNVSTDWL